MIIIVNINSPFKHFFLPILHVGKNDNPSEKLLLLFRILLILVVLRTSYPVYTRREQISQKCPTNPTNVRDPRESTVIITSTGDVVGLFLHGLELGQAV